MVFVTRLMRSELPPLAKARVSGKIVHALFARARDIGLDLDELTAAAGLPGAARDQVGAVSVQSFLALLEAGASLSNDPLFGLHFGQELRVTDVPGYGLALCVCRTLGDALQLVVRFECLVHDLGRTEISEKDGVVHYRWRTPWLDLQGGRHLIEFAAAGLCAHVNWIAGRQVTAIEIASPCPPAPGVAAAEYEMVFCSPVRFGAEDAGIRFSAKLLDEPIPNADIGFFSTLTHLAEKWLLDKSRQDETSTIVPLAREKVKAGFLNGGASLSQIAAALKLSERSLQRRLSQAEVSFSELVDETRRELVLAYIRDDEMRIADIAARLGFADQSSFNHKFRAWFGTTPKIMRENLKSGRAAP